MRLMAAVDGASARRLQALSRASYSTLMVLLATAQNETSRFAFDAAKDNWGMLVAGVLVTLLWLLFRKMLELSERKQNGKK